MRNGRDEFDTEVIALMALATSAGVPSTSLRNRVRASAARDRRYGLFADRVARLFDVSLERALGYLARLADK